MVLFTTQRRVVTGICSSREARRKESRAGLKGCLLYAFHIFITLRRCRWTFITFNLRMDLFDI
uniref:Uncharacterized protein n=1 Tax=Strigamia maritima TaxID=126957 RepID=T1IWB7_STRMM